MTKYTRQAGDISEDSHRKIPPLLGPYPSLKSMLAAFDRGYLRAMAQGSQRLER